MKTVISTFSGCGGSSLGYKLAGYKELLAIDNDTHSVNTFRDNFPNVPCWQMDIADVKVEEIFKETGLKKGELDVLDGSPPCQGFSTAGKRQVNDDRNQLFNNFIRLISELEPKVFVMENVSGMVKGKMKGLFLEILASLQALNYVVKVKLLNSGNYSVPQARQRLFFIGVRKDLNKEPVFPIPLNTVVTVKDAIGDLEESKSEFKFSDNPRVQNILSKIKPGKNGATVDLNKSYFNLVRLKETSLSPTICKTVTNATGIIHYKYHRFITIKELKRLASFPDDFILKGKFQEQWARIGNAVMPLQMKAIALTIKEKILI